MRIRIDSQLMRTFVSTRIIQAGTIQNNQCRTACGPGAIKLNHLWVYATLPRIFGGVKGHNDPVSEMTWTNVACSKQMGEVHVFSWWKKVYGFKVRGSGFSPAAGLRSGQFDRKKKQMNIEP
jgi:hypothetical protein